MNRNFLMTVGALAVLALVGTALPATANCLFACPGPSVAYYPTTLWRKVSLVDAGSPPVGYAGVVHVDITAGDGVDLAGFGTTDPCQLYDDVNFVSRCTVLTSQPVYDVKAAGYSVCVYDAFFGVDLTNSSPDGYDYHTDAAVYVGAC